MRLKIKLVIAISLMVVAIVLTLSTIYVAQLVHHVISDGVDNGEYAANQIVHFTRDAIDRDLKDLNTTKIDPADQKQINDFIVESLQMDGGLNDLFQDHQ